VKRKESNMAGHGSFFWNELSTGDTEKSGAFFADLIGWERRSMPMVGGDEYIVFSANGEDVGGMYQMADAPAQWLSYIKVDDVDAALARVTKLGGKVLREAMDIPGVGRMGVIADPSGVAVALMTTEKG
jgi:predicted enzyme related to lactoylglutathione lyase